VNPTKCGEKAVLLITSSVAGTSTTLARRRIDLMCALDVGHEGAHQHADESGELERWEAQAGARPTLLRQDDADE
jgi:hypothetical protein